MMLFGCDPEHGVEADTKFIYHIELSFDSRTVSIVIPQCLC